MFCVYSYRPPGQKIKIVPTSHSVGMWTRLRGGASPVFKKASHCAKSSLNCIKIGQRGVIIHQF